MILAAGRALAAFAALALLPASGFAQDCGFRSGPDQGAAWRPLATLPEGISRGEAQCEGVRRPMAIWTLGVDPTASDLGLRDRPLFRSREANPLVAVADAEVGGIGRMTLFKRREDAGLGDPPAGRADRRPSYRLFGTFCDAGSAEPLHCALDRARIKMRADVVDSDGDGALDRVRHQVSIWDGAERLQVLMFDAPHTGRPLANAVPWIEALRLAGRL